MSRRQVAKRSAVQFRSSVASAPACALANADGELHAAADSSAMLPHHTAMRAEVSPLQLATYPTPNSCQLSTPGGNYVHDDKSGQSSQSAAPIGNYSGQFSVPGGNFIQPEAQQRLQLVVIESRSGQVSRPGGTFIHADHRNAPPPIRAATQSSFWHASLLLGFRKQDARTRLWRTRHEGPLYVQRPFYPEGADLAHVYLLHPPGGLVSGDRLVVKLDLDSGARVLCTTPGAGRLYRARPDQRLQEQHNYLQVGSGASLEWFPQETLVFPGAQAHIDTRVELAVDAQFCGWDISVLGLPANDIRFDHGRLRQRLLIQRAGMPVLLEALDIDGVSSSLPTAAAGLRSQPVSGLFVCGPFDASQFDAVDTAALVAAATVAHPALRGLTRHGDFLLGRYLGPCAQEARRVFLLWWAALRPLLLQRAACPAAIWST